MDIQMVGEIIMSIAFVFAVFSGLFYKIIINRFNINISKDTVLNKLTCILGIIAWAGLLLLTVGLADKYQKYLYLFICIIIIALSLLFILIYINLKKLIPTILVMLLIIIVGPFWLFAIGFGKI
jgi:hypothetical protein